MTEPGRDPYTRSVFLTDRVRALIAQHAAGEGFPTNEGWQEFQKQVQLAFHMAEERGEQRGRLKERGLCKLTQEERAALGV